MANLHGESNMMFFPTPAKEGEIMDLIASCIKAFDKSIRNRVPMLDATCGDGVAIERLKFLLGGKIYGNELDKERAAVARPRFGEGCFAEGDRFHLDSSANFSVILSNPPYRIEQGGERAEAVHFAEDFKLLIDHGLFIGIIPQTVINADFMKLLNDNLYHINVRKFPEPFFTQRPDARFKQYVIFGLKRTEALDKIPTPSQYNEIAQKCLEMPELKFAEFQYEIPETVKKIHRFKTAFPDVDEMFKLLAENNLHKDAKFIELFNPGSMTDIARSLTDPQLGHVATILLSGIMQSMELPIDGVTHIIKGMSSKGWRRNGDSQEITNGDKTKVITEDLEKPTSTINAMSMETGRVLSYNSMDNRTEFANFLDSNQETFVNTIREQFMPIFDPTREVNGEQMIEKFLPLFSQVIPPGALPGTDEAQILPAQIVAVSALYYRLFGDKAAGIDPSKAALLIGEMGVGKTLMLLSLMAMLYQLEIKKQKPNQPKKPIQYTEQELKARALKAKRTQNKRPDARKLAKKMVVTCPANIPAEWKAQAEQALANFDVKVHWIGEEKVQPILIKREDEPQGFSALEAYGGSSTAQIVSAELENYGEAETNLDKLKRFRYAKLERMVNEEKREKIWSAYKLAMTDLTEFAAKQFAKMITNYGLSLERFLAPRSEKSKSTVSYPRITVPIVSYGRGIVNDRIGYVKNPEPAKRTVHENVRYGKFMAGDGGRGIIKMMKCSRAITDTAAAMAQDGLVVLVVSLEKLKAGANWCNVEEGLMRRMSTKMGTVEVKENPKGVYHYDQSHIPAKISYEKRRIYTFDQPICPVCGHEARTVESYKDEPLKRHYCTKDVYHEHGIMLKETLEEKEHPLKDWVQVGEDEAGEAVWEWQEIPIEGQAISKGEWLRGQNNVYKYVVTGRAMKKVKVNVGSQISLKCGLTKRYLNEEGEEIPKTSLYTQLWTMFPHSNGGRIPIARFLNQRYRGQYYLFVDEIHKAKSGGADGANVSQAMMQVIHGAVKVVGATGTVYAGYAKDIFYLLYRLFPWMRENFGYYDEKEFVAKYGFQRRVMTETWDDSTNANGYTSSGKTVYHDTPGVTPDIIMMLLSYSVFIRKDDLGIKMPPFSESVMDVAWDNRLNEGVAALEDMHTPGKEFYTPTSILSKWRIALQQGAWLDCPVTRDIVCEWTEKRKDGSKERKKETFHIPGPMSHPDELLEPPLKKDQAMLELVQDSLAQGRGVMIFCEFTNEYPVMNRLHLLFAKHNVYSEVLPDNVDASGRGKWYRQAVNNARGKGQEPVVIVPGGKFVEGVNCVETPTEVEYGVQYKINILRQRGKRAHRANQPKPVEVIFPVYEDSYPSYALKKIVFPKLRAAQTVDGQLLSSALAEYSPDGDDITSMVNEMMVNKGLAKQDDWLDIPTYKVGQAAVVIDATATVVKPVSKLAQEDDIEFDMNQWRWQQMMTNNQQPASDDTAKEKSKRGAVTRRTPMQVTIDDVLMAWDKYDEFYQALEKNEAFHLKVESECNGTLGIEVFPLPSEAIISVTHAGTGITFNQNWEGLNSSDDYMGPSKSSINNMAIRLRNQGFTDVPTVVAEPKPLAQPETEYQASLNNAAKQLLTNRSAVLPALPKAEPTPNSISMPMLVTAVAKATAKPKNDLFDMDMLVLLAGGDPTPRPTMSQTQAKPTPKTNSQTLSDMDLLVLLAGGDPTPRPTASQPQAKSTPKAKNSLADMDLLAMLAM